MDRYDVAIFQGATAAGPAPLAAGLAPGSACAGVAGLAQRWVIRFLQPLGSVRYRPGVGTAFVPLLRGGRLRTDADARLAFAAAEMAVRRQLQAEDEAEAALPGDARIDRATLLSLTVAPGLLTLRVRIASAAGATREVKLPIPFLP